MDTITVGDIVQIVRVGDKDRPLLNKVGRVMMIADGKRAVLSFDDGSGAAVEVSQLAKVR